MNTPLQWQEREYGWFASTDALNFVVHRDGLWELGAEQFDAKGFSGSVEQAKAYCEELATALAPKPEPQEPLYRIRPLEWGIALFAKPECEHWCADTDWLSFRAYKNPRGNGYKATWQADRGAEEIGVFPALREAKSACEIYWAQTMQSLLIPADAKTPASPVSG